MQTIDSFMGDFRFLSNFYVDEEHTVSVEHKYQAAKATNLVDYLKIMQSPLPRDAKRLSKTIAIRPDWNDIRLIIMEQCLIEKFSNSGLALRLVGTNDATLIEGNNWGDNFWGVCDGVGKNQLGCLLMKIRDRFITNKFMVEY